MDVFRELTLWHWFILGAVLIVVEMLAPGVIFLWLGLAAVATGIVVAVAPALGWEIQLLLFAALSAASIYAGRRFIANRPAATDHPTLNERGRDYIGRVYVLGEALQNGTGKLTIDDTIWSITGPDAPAGARVKVTGMDGMVLLVVPADSLS